LSTLALFRLAANPPRSAGFIQRRASAWLVRPFPLGLRFSGKNMSPLPGWLVGAQSVALNMSNNDLAMQLHYALFNGSGGYVLKPLEMSGAYLSATRSADDDDDDRELLSMSVEGSRGTCSSSRAFSERKSSAAPRPSSRRSTAIDSESDARDTSLTATRSSKPRFSKKACSFMGGFAFGETTGDDGRDDSYWPPAREELQCIDISVLSLHALPKRGEQRPRYDGSRGACHGYHPELSGKAIPPNSLNPSCPQLSVTLHPIGGFCAISNMLPLPKSVDWKMAINVPDANGMNAAVVRTVHCVAAEPLATFLKIAVTEGVSGKEVAYEICVLGRLRRGYRVIQLRGPLGTRIALCYVLVQISFGDPQKNVWATPRQLRLQSNQQRVEVKELRGELQRMRSQLAAVEPDDESSYNSFKARSSGRQPCVNDRRSVCA